MQQSQPTKLKKQLGLLALTATGICSMLGASINVVPFMIQRNVVGIEPYVIPDIFGYFLKCLTATAFYMSNWF